MHTWLGLLQEAADSLQHAGHSESGAPGLAQDGEPHGAVQPHVAVVDPRAERHLYALSLIHI